MSTSDDCPDIGQNQAVVEQRDRFESAWRAGREPSIEAHLDEVPETDRQLLLRELMVVEIEWRRKRGERPTPSEYHVRFPDHSQLVEAAFAEGPSARRPDEGAKQSPPQSNPDTACNLLFGILALQNSFIDRAALLSAFNIWTDDKTKPLGRILLEQGKLDSSRHALLAALVAEHLKHHGGDPDRSLAGLSSLGPVRHDLENLADAELAVSLGHVGTSRSIEPDPYATQSYVGSPTSGGVRFHILRPHARGGLGEVFAAFDEELHREVALKCIQDHHADDPSSRARFVQEAEITGGLEHPGIVPVYGLGHYNNGRPFYAMRLVKGDSLRTAIKQFHDTDQDSNRDPGERSVSLRRLLGRFLDVCNAVAYAHSRGVLHRDLKPGNILLGKYGETLIIDWGLAKVVGRSDPKSADAEPTLRPLSGSTFESTRAGSAIGTPGYMSPEQARGDIDKLGPASDVFSLGATLYHLLTGRPAFEGQDFAERLQKNERCEFAAPRVIKPSIPRPLEAICLKAMAPQQGDRYGPPRALAEDIEHWLADEPVTALPESRSQKAARWARRHRAATQAAAGALVVISAVSIVSALLINQARHGEHTALNAANNALVAETDAKKEAQAQRNRAEDRELLAINSVKKFRDAVANNPELIIRENLKPLRNMLLKEPLDFFRSLRDQLQTQSGTRPETMAHLASASFDLALTSSYIGTSRDALRAFKESCEVQEQLVREHPDIAEFQWYLGRCLINIGNTHRAMGQGDDAIISYREAREILERLVARDSTSVDFQNELAELYSQFSLLQVLGQPRIALELQENALKIRERLAREYPAEARFKFDLATSLCRIGQCLNMMGRSSDGLESALKAQEIYENNKFNEDTLKDIDDIALCHIFIGGLLTAKGQRLEAGQSFRKAIDILEPVARTKPTHYVLDQLSMAYNGMATLLEASQPDAGLELYRKALGIQERMAQEKFDKAERENAIVRTHTSIGRLQLSVNRRADAMESFGKALVLCERLISLQLDKSQSTDALVALLDTKCDLSSRLGRRESALESSQKALVIRERQAQAQPENHTYLGDLAGRYSKAGDLLEEAGRKTEALQSFEKALAVYAKLIATEPGKGQSDDALVAIYDLMGNLSRRLGRPGEGLATNQKALVIRERQALEQPDKLNYQTGLAGSYYHMGGLLDQVGRKTEALRSFEKALTVYKKLAGPQPGKSEYDEALISTYDCIDGLLTHSGRRAEALETFQKALVIRERRAQAHADNIVYQNDLAAANTGLGNMLDRIGRRTEALESFKKSSAVLERLVRLQPGNTQSENALIAGYDGVGAQLVRMSRPAEAIEFVKKSQAIRERMAQAQPDNLQYQLSLAGGYGYTGFQLLFTGQGQEARDSLKKALAIGERLTRQHPDSAEVASMLGVTLHHLAFLDERWDWNEARKTSRRGIELQKRAVALDPGNAAYPGHLRNQWIQLGNLALRHGVPAEAAEVAREWAASVPGKSRDLYDAATLLFRCVPLAKDKPERNRYAETAIQMFQAAIAANSSTVSHVSNDPNYFPVIVAAHSRIGSLSFRMGRDSDARESYLKAQRLGEAEVREHPNSAGVASELSMSLHGLASLQSKQDRATARETMRQALVQQKRALLLDPGNFSYQNELINRLIGLQRIAPAQGVPAEAIEAARELASRRAGDSGSLYNVACILSRCVPLAKNEAERDRCAYDAMQALRVAVAAGWSRAVWASRDPDLVPLHKRGDFRRLVGELFDRGFPADPFTR